MKSRRRTAVALAVMILLAFPTTSLGDTFRVKASGSMPSDFRWMPDFHGISKGDRVRWTNPTETTHRVVAYKGPWSKNTAIAPGERTSKVFDRNGAYYYRCTRPGHSTLIDGDCNGMCGHIHVSS